MSPSKISGLRKSFAMGTAQIIRILFSKLSEHCFRIILRNSFAHPKIRRPSQREKLCRPFYICFIRTRLVSFSSQVIVKLHYATSYQSEKTRTNVSTRKLATYSVPLQGLFHQIFKSFLLSTILNQYFLYGRWWFRIFFFKGLN